jgi:uncharacterized sporulation protein YeaH/YhbH (DUF444 family)
MSFTIIDKRTNTNDRSAENRQRFLKRIKGAIKEQMPDLISKKNLKDMDSSGGNIKINKKSIREPEFRYGDGGDIDRVLPGNQEYVPGDLIRRPGQNGGRGKSGSTSGQTEDDFIVELSKEEFLKYLFEDLELPDMVETDLRKMTVTHRENSGFQVDGSPNRLSIVRSYKQSLARRLPLKHKYDKEITEKEDELFALQSLVYDVNSDINMRDFEADRMNKIDTLILAIEDLKRKQSAVPLFDEIDLRYRSSVKRETPVMHATMIMIMDNSGSMGLKEKTIARKFFWLLYSFLRKEYEKIDLRFISHTEEAEELNEEQFFNTSVSGGTVVSSALDLTKDIIKSELAGKTNIYIAQVSDGDNYDSDNPTCVDLLKESILPYARYMAYIQVDRYGFTDDEETNTGLSAYVNGLWKSYKELSKTQKNLQLAKVSEEREIYAVFHELFSRKTNKG